MINPSAKNRIADAYVPAESKHQHPNDLKEQQLEQDLEESMAGSGPVSVSQPGSSSANVHKAIDDATLLAIRAAALI
jgi:hypothetical protein